jgi:hypothetical protein
MATYSLENRSMFARPTHGDPFRAYRYGHALPLNRAFAAVKLLAQRD